MDDLDALAETLDRWAASSTVSLTELDAQLTVNRLDGVQAGELLALLDRVGWTVLELSDRGGDIPRDLLTPLSTGVRLSAAKPAAPQGVELVLTNTAFAAALGRETITARFWIRRLKTPVSTVGVRFAPWGDDTLDPAAEKPPEPRKVVRFLRPSPASERDLSRWLLRNPDQALPENDHTFEVWKSSAASALAIAIANEVDTDGTLLFRGPPVSRFKLEEVGELTNTAFADLQRAASWAFESPRELENRQGLLASEMARGARRDGTLPALCDITRRALEGARIAYSFGVTQQSKDTLKALADLRKAVMDETSKLSDSMRALAGAVSGAAFGAISLIVARLTLTSSSKFVTVAAVAIGVVLGVYVCSVITSGLHFMSLQRTLREDWRARLYSFLTEDEYKKLVEAPVKRAERGYKIAAWVGGIMTTILLGSTVFILLTPLPAAPPSPVVLPPAPPPTAVSPSHAPGGSRSNEPTSAPPGSAAEQTKGLAETAAGGQQEAQPTKDKAPAHVAGRSD